MRPPPGWLAKAGAAAAVVAVVGFASRTATVPSNDAWVGDPLAPAALEAALNKGFAGDDCVPASSARERISRLLRGLDLAAWRIEAAPGSDSARCVGPAMDTVQQRVLLLPTMPAELRAELDSLGEALREECLSEEGADSRLRSVLTEAGELDFVIRHDGPVGAPLDAVEEAEAHVAAGCWVYSGTGFDDDGRRVFFLAGR